MALLGDVVEIGDVGNFVHLFRDGRYDGRVGVAEGASGDAGYAVEEFATVDGEEIGARAVRHDEGVAGIGVHDDFVKGVGKGGGGRLRDCFDRNASSMGRLERDGGGS